MAFVLLYFAPKFYQWVNTIIENKFPSLEKDHPRLVIPFFEKNKMFALQGRAFGDENPKYVTIKLQDKDKIIFNKKFTKTQSIAILTGVTVSCLAKKTGDKILTKTYAGTPIAKACKALAESTLSCIENSPLSKKEPIIGSAIINIATEAGIANNKQNSMARFCVYKALPFSF